MIDLLYPYLPAIGGAIAQIFRQGWAMLKRKMDPVDEVYFEGWKSLGKIIYAAVGGAVIGAAAGLISDDPFSRLTAGFMAGFAVVDASETGKAILSEGIEKLRV